MHVYYVNVRKPSLEKMERKRRRDSQRRAANPTVRENWAERIVAIVRRRARQKKLPFAITPRDLYLPDICPVLGVALRYGGKLDPCAATVDRIIPSRGYVPGNVAVISRRANMMKQDATLSELRSLVAWLDGIN